MPPAEGLVGRFEALADIGRALDGARAGAGTTVFFEGPAGIGKTSLLACARQQAVASGMRVLAGRGSPLEHEFAMGVVRQCFGAAVHADPDVFQGAAGRARDALQPAPQHEPAAPEAVLHGLFWLTANLAEKAPVVLLIDDAHWADEASLRFAAYLALRVDALPVALFVAVRTGEGESVVLRAIRDSPGAHLLAVDGLTEEQVHDVLRARTGESVDPGFARACAEATGGNPFLLGELVSTLVAAGTPLTAAHVAAVSETTPRSVTRRVSATLERLEPSARALASAVAVLGEDVALDLGAELAGLDQADAMAAAATLTDAGLLADSMPLQFRHPLLASAVRATLSAANRAASHQRAAELLRARAATPERIALHLLHVLATGHPRVVTELRRAATLAVRRGAPTAAVALLRRALAEPPPPAELAELLLELGTSEFATGAAAHAAEHLAAAADATDDPALQARALLRLLHTGEWGGIEGMRRLGPQLLDAARRVEPVDRELALRLRANLLSFPQIGGDQLATTRELAADLDGTTPGEAILLSSLAFVLTWADASADEVAGLAERALPQAEAVIAGGAMTELVSGTIVALRWTDRLGAAQRLLDDALASAQRRGSSADYVMALSERASVHRRAGRLRESEADILAALAAESDPRWWFAGHLYAALIGTLTDIGRLDDAERMLASSPADETTDSPAHIAFILERMRLRATQGDHGAAVADWAEAVRRASAVRGLSPAWIDDLVVAADAHAALGDEAAAQQLRNQAHALAHRWGAPRALAVAARARGDLVTAIEQARRSPAELELARALIGRGAQLRRARERAAARDPLREGYERARRCGADTLAEFARAELRATGARLQREVVSGRDALTPSERRIAELAASGRSNVEIAQSQFLTVKTVEMHLTRAYRKLAISGRGELSRALA